MLPQATADLYRSEQRRVAATLAVTRDLWDTVRTPQQAQALLPRLTAILSASMVGAATDGAASVGPALAETGFDVEPVAAVQPQAFGLSASDGRPLDSLLAGPVIRSQASMTAGRAALDRIIHTQVADSVRGGSSVAITARPKVGWVRTVNPPCCQDCAVLAGKWFKHNTGFQRHPNCDCVHRPAHQDESPAGYTQDVPAEEINDLTEGQRAALDEGADLGRVVNAYRDEVPGRRARMTTTTELGTRRRTRLTPDGIYATSTTREEAIRRLREHGYLL